MSKLNSKHTNKVNVAGHDQPGRLPALHTARPLEDEQLSQVCGGSGRSSRAPMSDGAVIFITDSIEAG